MKRKTIAIVGVVLAAALLATFLLIRKGPPQPQPPPLSQSQAQPQSLAMDSSLSKLFGGEDGLMTVAQPTKVEAYRLKPNLKNDGTSQTDPEGNYEVTAGPIAVPKIVAAKFSKFLVMPESYEREMEKPCEPRYGVRLSFLRGSDRVDVYLCFECANLLVVRNGKVTGEEDFDPMSAILARAVKTLFPEDSEIQKLQPINYELPD